MYMLINHVQYVSEMPVNPSRQYCSDWQLLETIDGGNKCLALSDSSTAVIMKKLNQSFPFIAQSSGYTIITESTVSDAINVPLTYDRIKQFVSLVKTRYPQLVTKSNILDNVCEIEFTPPTGMCVRYGFCLETTLKGWRTEDCKGTSTLKTFECTYENDLNKWLIDIRSWILVRDLESNGWFNK